jgi:hypothetical protein
VVGPVWRRGPEHSDLLVPRTAAGQADPTASRKEQMRRERIMGANTRRGGTVEARQLPPRGRAHYLTIYGRQRPAETLVRSGSREIHGKDGVAGSIPAGGSTTTPQVRPSTRPDLSCDEDPATAFAREFATPTCTL